MDYSKRVPPFGEGRCSSEASEREGTGDGWPACSPWDSVFNLIQIVLGLPSVMGLPLSTRLYSASCASSIKVQTDQSPVAVAKAKAKACPEPRHLEAPSGAWSPKQSLIHS